MFMQIDTKKGLNKAATKSLAVARPYSIDDETFNQFKEALEWLNAHPDAWYTGKEETFKALNQSSAIVGLIGELIAFRKSLETGSKKRK